MNRTLVESSNIKSIGYENDILEIEFFPASVYQYTDVSKDLYESMMKAPSKGKFFHAFIRPKFKAIKIVPIEKEKMMKTEDTGCKGYYLDEEGNCEVLTLEGDTKPTLKDCKKCSCPYNIYSKDKD